MALNIFMTAVIMIAFVGCMATLFPNPPDWVKIIGGLTFILSVVAIPASLLFSVWS